MARKTSEFLKAFGKAFEVFKVLVDEVLSRGGDDEDVSRILTDKSLRRKIGDLILNTKVLLKEITYTFRFVVNYDQPLDQAIKEGKYDRVNNDINPKNFPFNQTGQKEVELVLFHFGKGMSSEAVITFGKQHGFRPATLPKLLKFGAEQPELQRQFSIVALGSVWVDRYGLRQVPFLWYDLVRRYLDIRWFDVNWDDRCRFLFVREQVT